MKHLSSSKPYVMPESVRQQVYGPIVAMPDGPRSRLRPSRLQRLVGKAASIAIARGRK